MGKEGYYGSGLLEQDGQRGQGRGLFMHYRNASGKRVCQHALSIIDASMKDVEVLQRQCTFGEGLANLLRAFLD